MNEKVQYFVQWAPLNVITDNVIIRSMLSVSICPKVITLSGFHCITKIKKGLKSQGRLKKVRYFI
jgi:hypothetical protein